METNRAKLWTVEQLAEVLEPYTYTSKEDAAHIVRCVNAHESLVKALEKADAILEAVYAQYPVPEIKQALAHAKGEGA